MGDHDVLPPMPALFSSYWQPFSLTLVKTRPHIDFIYTERYLGLGMTIDL